MEQPAASSVVIISKFSPSFLDRKRRRRRRQQRQGSEVMLACPRDPCTRPMAAATSWGQLALIAVLTTQLVSISAGLPTSAQNIASINNNQPAFSSYLARQQTTMLYPSKTTQAPTQQFAPPPVNQNQLPSQFILNPYTRATHELLLNLRQQILTRSIKFDEHFRNLLSASKLNLHNTFADTYGMTYEHNTEIFTGMFEGLEQYYANGQIKLTKSMESFFARLYQKIFQVYNSNRSFSPSYLECATDQLTHLKPFKDVPEKLINEIRHAFVAARTFHQALNSGIDIIKTIISVSRRSPLF